MCVVVSIRPGPYMSRWIAYASRKWASAFS